MSTKDFKAWKKRGVFKISHARILQVSNNISEGEHDDYTKEEAAQVASYWKLCHVAALNTVERIKMESLLGALQLATRMQGRKRKK